MSIYDILMLSVLVGCILFGLWKGLAWQIASLTSIFVSYFVALGFRGALSQYISAQEPWNHFAAMLILFLGTSLIIWLSYGYMKATIERMRLRGFDTQAGGILGAIKGALLCMVITLFAVTLFGTNVREAVVASKSGGYIATAINRLNAMVPDEIHAVLDNHVQQFNENLDEQAPDFIAKSKEKVEQKLQTIRGKFNTPRTGQYTNASEGEVKIGPNANVADGASNVGEAATATGNQILNAAKEAGKNFLNDNFNR